MCLNDWTDIVLALANLRKNIKQPKREKEIKWKPKGKISSPDKISIDFNSEEASPKFEVD